MPPKISRTNAVIAAIAISLMGLGCFVPFVWKVVYPFAATGHASADWTWPKIGVATLVMVALFFYLGYVVFQRFGTKLTESEIVVPTLRGIRRLPWAQVQRIGVRGHELRFEGPCGTITVNVLCFSKPQEAEAFIRAHLPSQFGTTASAA